MSKKPTPKTIGKKPAAKKASGAVKKPAPLPKKVKKAAPAKKPTAAAKKAAPAKKPIAAAKKATKPGVPAKKAAAKPSTKPSTKPAAKAAAPKPAVKAAAAKPAAAPAGSKPATKAASGTAAPKTISHKASESMTQTSGKVMSVAPVAPAPPKRLSSRAAARANAVPAQAPLPPPTSRFADRFAPPRPPTRQMAQVELDTPRPVHVADPKLANAWKTKSGRDLTEAEILAMPEAEYMNDKQLEFFRRTLQALKDGLLSNAGATTEHLREDTSIVPDPADRATIEEEHALELRTRDRERKLLKKISQSLSRIEAGEYGFCDETGEPIGLGRLIARPTATLSLEAQQRRELKQKMFGD